MWMHNYKRSPIQWHLNLFYIPMPSALHGKIGHTNFAVQKRDGHTNKWKNSNPPNSERW